MNLPTSVIQATPTVTPKIRLREPWLSRMVDYSPGGSDIGDLDEDDVSGSSASSKSGTDSCTQNSFA